MGDDYSFLNFGNSPEDEYLRQLQGTQVQNGAQGLLGSLGQTDASQAAGQMAQQGQAAFQQAMAAKNNLAAQRDAAMQSTQAQAQQQQAQEEQKKQQMLGLVSMATGGFGLGKALGKAAGAVAGKAGGAAVGTSTAAQEAANSLMPKIDWLNKGASAIGGYFPMT